MMQTNNYMLRNDHANKTIVETLFRLEYDSGGSNTKLFNTWDSEQQFAGNIMKSILLND